MVYICSLHNIVYQLYLKFFKKRPLCDRMLIRRHSSEPATISVKPVVSVEKTCVGMDRCFKNTPYLQRKGCFLFLSCVSQKAFQFFVVLMNDHQEETCSQKV